MQQDRCWLNYGLAHIAGAPGRWLRLVPAKLAYTFDHESFAVEYLREARPSAWPEARRVSVRGVLTAIHRISIVASPLAFVGFVRSRKRARDEAVDTHPVEDPRGRARLTQTVLLALLAVGTYAALAADTPMFWPLVIVTCLLPWLALPGRPQAEPSLRMAVSLLATTALAHAIFFGEDRYHVVVTPVLCLLAAAALREREDAPDTRAARTPEVCAPRAEAQA